MIKRRDALKTFALAAGAYAVTPRIGLAAESSAKQTYPFQLPGLGYSYDAIEPYIDTMTMQLHHDKHHAAYVKNLNEALQKADPKFQQLSVEELLQQIDTMPENIRNVVRNNAGGHYNHTIFWAMLKKNENGKPSGDLAKAIDQSFGSYDAFKTKFSEAATKVFGSGWAWLAADGKKLEITSTPNQDSPIAKKVMPVLGLDVWEHSYYLKYQNRRPEYIAAFWNAINWSYAGERYQEAMKA